ncbi:MAG: TolC family protein [Bacteroidaceae bacterium]|nr:TolC family protein [Bacteroidaceae bacterium]
MNKANTLLTSALLLMTATITRAQQISLSDLFDIAEEESQAIRISHLAASKAEESICHAKSNRLPDISAELSVGYLADALLSNRDFSHWTHIDNPHFTNNFTLKAQQVIYSGGALTSGIRMAQTQKRLAELNLTANRQEIRFIIAGLYLDICRLQNQAHVITDNIALSDTLLAQTSSRVTAGTALTTDLTRQELHHEKLLLRLRQTQDAISVLRHQLSTTLHRDITGCSLTLDTLTSDSIASINTRPWQQEASCTNARIDQASADITIKRHMLKTKQSDMLPKIAIVAENHFNGPITFEVPVLNSNINYWFAGIGIQYSLSSIWKSNKPLRQARFDLMSSQENLTLVREEISNGVKSAHTSLLTAQTELNTHRKSLQLAKEHYGIIANRYSNGLCLLTDLLDAANTRLSAELSLVDSHINIMYHYYQLRYLTSTL